MLRRRPLFLFPLLAASLLSCEDLPTIEEDRCGNGFIEPGEDCDNFVEKKNPEDAICIASGAANQCHFQCATLKQCQDALGDGARCGVDKVCRQPQGDDGGKGTFFTPASSLIPGLPDELLSGDFDGDGRKDILTVGQAGFDIHYFAGDGNLAKSLSIPGAPVIPAIGRLTTTAADDFTLDVGRGIGVMLGRNGQTVEPTSYLSLDLATRYPELFKAGPPDNIRLVIVDTGVKMMGKRLGPVPLALASTTDTVALFDAAKPGSGTAFLADFPELGSKVPLGPIPVAFPKLGADRQLFLLAFQDESSVFLIDPGATGPAQIKSKIELPTGFTVHGAAFFKDVNDDDVVDVLVGVASCSGGPDSCVAELDVAYGDGDGRFYGDPVWTATKQGQAVSFLNVYPDGEPPMPSMGPMKTLSTADMEPYLPLAIDLLNADKKIDYVNAFGIYMSNGGKLLNCNNTANLYCQVERSSGGQLWSEVAIGDFNDDSRLDVAAVTRGAKGIDFFNGAGTGIFGTFSIPTDGAPSNLAIGDFDGDLVSDLAFDSVLSELITDGTMSTPTRVDSHTLFVAFGQPTGAPDLPVSMGEVANLLQIAPGSLSSLGNDAAADIVILSGKPAKVEAEVKIDGADWKVGLSQGNGYRQLQAPLLFFKTNSIDVDGSPLASAIGLFDGDGNRHADLAVVVQTKATNTMGGPGFCQDKVALAVLPATNDAAIDTPPDASKFTDIVAADPNTPDNVLPVRRLFEAVPINVDGGSTDRLLITFPTYEGSCDDMAMIKPQGKLLIASFDANGKATVTPLIPSVGSNEFLLHVKVGDLDGDDKVDIAALQIELDFTTGRVKNSKVVVLLGKGGGSFEDRIDLPVKGIPVDFALINTDGDSALEVVGVAYYNVNNDVGAQLFVIDGPETRATPPTASRFTRLLPRADSSVLEHPSVLVGGDFDGDGVDDVAVAVAGGIQMLKGVAR